MQPTSTIRLLSADKNEKGDLFTRLTEHLFFALGYGELQRDLAQPGREIDVMGKHRTEPRQMCAECKAHKKKMGGDEVNKFRGALQGEQRKAGALPTTGYFLSLGGFTGSAIEQEKQHGKKGIILLDAPRIIHELEGSLFLVNDAQATEQAGRCVQLAGLRDVKVDKIELLGHELGYIKAVHFAHNNQVTHFALIHYDGSSLALEPAQVVIAADKASGGHLHKLQYLPPAPAAPSLQQLEQEALAFYCNWISEECGYMQLDGLPLDDHKGPKKPRLESLFVPLRAEIESQVYVENYSIPDDVEDDFNTEEEYEPGELEPDVATSDDYDYPFAEPYDPSISIGELLKFYKHIAFLAAPGGGKSTLLKRLAIAYAFPERHDEIADKLPRQQWLPLFLRCRELRGRTEQPIVQLLEQLSTHINMPVTHTDAFRAVLREALQAGHVLLLVDGLDEIADEGERKNFADNLRRFLVAYPQVGVVVTSRIAGFRIIAGVIGQVCQEATLSPLTEDDIQYICLQWHIEVDRDSPQVRKEAEKLAEQIIANRSILALAQNPLLLTTLLAVRRTLGELPTNRSGLYRETVRLLIKTWNVEGFRPMPEREVMAQLCYVACSMMDADIQQIPHERLMDLLLEAREVLAAELQYTKVSPEEFIEQVEYRSSLLMRIGQDKIDGEWQYIYEFRHLTFQEYLAAEGYVKRRHRRRHEKPSLVDLFEPHLRDSSWEEVITLAAVLAEDQAEPLVELLVALCDATPSNRLGERNEHFELLGKCLTDEVAIEPQTLRTALRQVARVASSSSFTPGILFILWDNQVKDILAEVVETEFLGSSDRWLNYAAAMRDFSCIQLLGVQPLYVTYETQAALPELIETVLQYLPPNNSRREQVMGALALSAIIDGLNFAERRNVPDLLEGYTPLMAQQLFDGLLAMMRSNDAACVYAACWPLSFAVLFNQLLDKVPVRAEDVMTLFYAWRTATHPEVAVQAAQALLLYAPLRRDELLAVSVTGEGHQDFLLTKARLIGPVSAGNFEAKAAALMGWYWRKPWQEQELAELLDKLYIVGTLSGFVSRNKTPDYKKVTNMLMALGQVGKEVLNRRNQQLKEAIRANEPPF